MTLPRYGGPDRLNVATDRMMAYLQAMYHAEEHRCDHCYGYGTQWAPAAGRPLGADIECDMCVSERADAERHTGMTRRRIDSGDPWSPTRWVPLDSSPAGEACPMCTGDAARAHDLIHHDGAA